VRKVLILTIGAVVGVLVVAPRFHHERARQRERAAERAAELADPRLTILERRAFQNTPSADAEDVQCVVMDWNTGGDTVATLVAFVDGTTRMYVSTGDTISDAGNHPAVRAAAARFRTLALARAGQFMTTADFDPPASGDIRFYIISSTRTLATRAQSYPALVGRYNSLKEMAEAARAAFTELQRTG
jgi:hypothetical protein